MQIEQLEKKLLDAEQLNNMCIEDYFDLQTQLSETQAQNERLKKEVQDVLTRFHDLERYTSQQCRDKDTELAAMRA